MRSSHSTQNIPTTHKSQGRHTFLAINMPTCIEPINHDNINSRHPTQPKQNTKILCKIKFTVDELAEDYEILVTPGMTSKTVATMMGQQLQCGYQSCIEDLVVQQLQCILNQGSQVDGVEEDTQWKEQMLKIINNQSYCREPQMLKIINNQSYCREPQLGAGSSYFQSVFNREKDPNSYKNSHELRTGKKISQVTAVKQSADTSHTRTNSIYDRCQLLKKQTQKKLNQQKLQRESKILNQCTFSPIINEYPSCDNGGKHAKEQSGISASIKCTQTEQHRNVKILKLKSDESDKSWAKTDNKQNTFDRLYRNAFDIENNRKKKLHHQQKQREKKLSELSFTPQINECSREICRIKSHASIFQAQRLQDELTKPRKTEPSPDVVYENGSETKLKFTPHISKMSRRIAQNLPSFHKKLQRQLSEISYKNKVKNRNQLNDVPKKTNKKYINGSRKTVKISSLQNCGNGEEEGKSVDPKIIKEMYYIDDSPHKLDLSDKKYRRLENPAACKVRSGSTEKKISAISPSSHPHNISQESQYCGSAHSISQESQYCESGFQLSRCNNIGQQNLNHSNLCKQLTDQYTKRNIPKIESSNNNTQKYLNQQNNKRSFFSENRRKVIFETIFDFLTASPALTISQFTNHDGNEHCKQDSQQISPEDISHHPYFPHAIKSMLMPMVRELDELSVMLNKEEFVWSGNRLYESLSVSEKGSLVGWGLKLLPKRLFTFVV